MAINKTSVARVLQEHPEGLKAREIAKILGVERKAVNSILYRYSKTDFVMDENYVWTYRRSFNDVLSDTEAKYLIPTQIKKSVPEQKATIKENSISGANPKSEATNNEEKAPPFNVVGCYYYTKAIDAITIQFDFSRGDPMYRPAVLLPEPSNPHDPNAIQVLVYNSQTKTLFHVGYVPKPKAETYSKYVDSYATAVIRKTENKYKIEIHVFPTKPKFDAPVHVISKSKPAPVKTVSSTQVTKEPTIPQQDNTVPVPVHREHRVIKRLVLIGLCIGGVSFLLNSIPKNGVRIKNASDAFMVIRDVLGMTYTSRSYDIEASVHVVLNNHVGREWYIKDLSVKVNGINKRSNDIVLEAGDEITFSGIVYEADSSADDVSEFGPFTHTITEKELQKAFTYTTPEILVKEKGGRKYAGAGAYVEVIFSFKP